MSEHKWKNENKIYLFEPDKTIKKEIIYQFKKVDKQLTILAEEMVAKNKN